MTNKKKYKSYGCRAAVCQAIVSAGLIVAAPALAQEAQTKKFDPLDLVTNKNPQLHFDKVDSDRIVTRRIDLVGDDGVVRLTLGAPLPNPVVDGVEYKRARPVNGLILRDANGNERGGIAFLDGLNTPALIFDHVASEAAGLGVLPDGSMQFQMTQRGEVTRDSRLGNRIVPGSGGPLRLSLSVPAKGEPAIELMDADAHPRLRLTLAANGAGSLQFLSADGKVIYALTPESDLDASGDYKTDKR